MLRSFERLCHPANTDLLIAADEEHAVVAGGRAYAMPWHWHDCLMFILPSRGTIELRHEDRRGGFPAVAGPVRGGASEPGP